MSRRTRLNEVNNPNKKKTKFTKESQLHNIEFIVKDLETHDLDTDDILKITNGKCEVIAYHELQKYKSIPQLLEKFGAVILLYETTKENFGHFTALYYNNENKLEFFDSYGFRPDEELKYADYNLEFGVPFLSKLIKDYESGGKKIVVADKQVQVFKDDVNTCGRWTAFRIRYRMILTLKQFYELFDNLKMFKTDFAISMLTFALTENTDSLTRYFKDKK